MLEDQKLEGSLVYIESLGQPRLHTQETALSSGCRLVA